jgi:hypothetical protein
VTPEGSFVPDALEVEARRFGCVPADEAPVEPAKETFSERQERIAEAVRAALAENKAEEFTQDGMPKVHAISKRLGERVTSEELMGVLERGVV